MRTARALRQEFVKAPSFVFEQIADEQLYNMAASTGIFIYTTGFAVRCVFCKKEVVWRYGVVHLWRSREKGS
jgi:hypothetical protein